MNVTNSSGTNVTWTNMTRASSNYRSDGSYPLEVALAVISGIGVIFFTSMTLYSLGCCCKPRVYESPLLLEFERQNAEEDIPVGICELSPHVREDLRWERHAVIRSEMEVEYDLHTRKVFRVNYFCRLTTTIFADCIPSIEEVVVVALPQ